MVDVLRELSKKRTFATPRRILDCIQGKITDSQSVIDDLPSDVTDRFTLRNGSPKKGRLDRLKKNIEKCLDNGFSYAQLLQMDRECVDNQGHIDTVRLRRILNREFDD